jgi:signal transduction histidine kinase
MSKQNGRKTTHPAFRKLKNRFMLLFMGLMTLTMSIALFVIFGFAYAAVMNEKAAILNDTSYITYAVAEEDGIAIVNSGAYASSTAEAASSNNLSGLSSAYYAAPIEIVLMSTSDGALVLDQTLVYTEDLLGENLQEVTEHLVKGVVAVSEGEVLEVEWYNGFVNVEGTEFEYSIIPYLVATEDIEYVTESGGVWSEDGYSSLYVHVADGHSITTDDLQYQVTYLMGDYTWSSLYPTMMLLAAVALLVLVLSFFVARFLAGRIVRPVENMWAAQRRFVADASHELKTPLTTIMTNYDVIMMNENETVASQKEWLGYMRRGMDRMSRLIGHLISLTRAEESAGISGVGSALGTGAGEGDGQTLTDVADVIREGIAAADARAQSRGLTVEANLAENLRPQAFCDTLAKIFEVLYENAVAYAEEGGKISVHLAPAGGPFTLTVGNSGPGIVPADQPHIFERFFRGDKAREQESESYGLGLSIAEAYVRSLGGQITCTSTPGVWTVFRVAI